MMPALVEQRPGWVPDGLRRQSELTITPNPATTGRQHPSGVVVTPSSVHLTGIRSSPARPLVPHPSSDRQPQFPIGGFGLKSHAYRISHLSSQTNTGRMRTLGQIQAA